MTTCQADKSHGLIGPMTTPPAPLAHTDGADCPACLDSDTWIKHHCYSCGGTFDPEAAALMTRLYIDDDLTETEMTRLNELTAKHARCFE